MYGYILEIIYIYCSMRKHYRADLQTIGLLLIFIYSVTIIVLPSNNWKKNLYNNWKKILNIFIRGGRLIEGAFILENFEKGGRLFEGAFKRRGRLIEVKRYWP